MAFVNEYISEENIEKFEINELMNSYEEKDYFPDKDYKHSWTIDKEREIWFMYASSLHDPLDRRVSLGETAFILNYQGENIEIVLSGINEENRKNRKEGFYYVSWELRRITPESLDGLSNNEIINLVKEALNAYGLNGIKTSVSFEKIIITCKF